MQNQEQLEQLRKVTANWWTPARAMGSLPNEWPVSIKKRWIAERLRGGLIVAVAKNRLTKGDSVASKFVYPVVPSAWEHWAFLSHDQEEFWTAGDVTLYDGYGSLIGRFYSVRLKPDDFVEVTGGSRVVEEPEPTEDRAAKKRLPDALLKKWHALFLEAHPDPTVTLAQKSVEGMFPNHHVTRDRLRELFPNARRGRPRKSEEN